MCHKEVKMFQYFKTRLSQQILAIPLNYIKKFIFKTLSKRKSEFSKIVCIHFRLSRVLNLHSQHEDIEQQFLKSTQIKISSHMRYGFSMATGKRIFNISASLNLQTQSSSVFIRDTNNYASAVITLPLPNHTTIPWSLALWKNQLAVCRPVETWSSEHLNN
jgi:hypothetical protein